MFLVFALASVPFDYTAPLPTSQMVTVRNINGDVRVRDGRRFAVHAVASATSSDLSVVRVRVDNGPQGVVVCVRYPPDTDVPCTEERGLRGTRNSDDVRVDIDVTVPAANMVDVASVNGAVRIVHDGPATAATVNGGIDVDARSVRTAHSTNGSIRLHVRDGHGETTAKTVNGSIVLEVPHGTGVKLNATTLNGSIVAPGVTVQDRRFGPGASADATLGDGALHASLQSLNGTVTLRN